MTPHPCATTSLEIERQRLTPMVKKLLRWLLMLLFRVKVTGLEHYQQAGDRVLIVSNHTSYLDPILLWAFLPDDVTFAINTEIARQWWVQPALRVARVFPMDPLQPLSIKSLTHYIKENQKAVIFPEGRITVTGALMKVYDGAAVVAEHSGAAILPIRIDGAQYTPVSRMHGIVRLRWFPPITLNILPPRNIMHRADADPHDRRHRMGIMLTDIMSDMMFETGHHERTLFAALLDARRIHGGGHKVLEDIRRKPMSYNSLIAQTLALGRKLEQITTRGEHVGLFLPNTNTTVAVFLGLQVYGRVPAMLNFSAGSRNIASAIKTAQIRTFITSRRFVINGKLESTVEALRDEVNILFLEDIADTIRSGDKLRALLGSLTTSFWYRDLDPKYSHRPAVVLFTSGSEGEPKGVVLSHANLLANREQLAARLDLNAQDTILNALPMFHAFGLTAGTLLPLFYGMKTFLYPSPLHYRIIPEIAYDLNATILFGTNTFLAGYAKYAHPYDFYSVRYVFAGAEKLQDDTRRLWVDKFGIRVLEGYGTTETSPILAANTPMFYQEGTVGRFMPGIDWQLEEVEGVSEGGRLHVAGPNIMLGYLRPQKPGHLEPPQSRFGLGWYDTGDIVRVDDHGFVTICGRVKRFAKIGGEMVSLTAVEDIAARVWPGTLHAAVTLSDEKKGEKIILVTQQREVERSEFLKGAQTLGFSELYTPREILHTKEIPLLGSGKVDYPALQRLVNETLTE
jgi:acyl-[acyl-carrier-protein]-phospholipid O-acyltransferase/long-chain-fatty-acid--[acyl-carrier-protein] ligase